MNHTFPQSFYPSYVEGSGQQLAAQIQPTTLACAYYPNFLLAWRPAQQPTEQGHHRHEVAPTYAPPNPHKSHLSRPRSLTSNHYPSTKPTSVTPSSTTTKTRTSPRQSDRPPYTAAHNWDDLANSWRVLNGVLDKEAEEGSPSARQQ